jgi:hypothetical protein
VCRRVVPSAMTRSQRKRIQRQKRKRVPKRKVILRRRERKLHIKRLKRKRKMKKGLKRRRTNRLLRLTLRPLPRTKHRPQQPPAPHLLTKEVRKNPVTNQKTKNQKKEVAKQRHPQHRRVAS